MRKSFKSTLFDLVMLMALTMTGCAWGDSTAVWNGGTLVNGWSRWSFGPNWKDSSTNATLEDKDVPGIAGSTYDTAKFTGPANVESPTVPINVALDFTEVPDAPEGAIRSVAILTQYDFKATNYGFTVPKGALIVYDRERDPV